MKMKIKKLKVKAFRGIRETTLDFDGKSLILYGENGFGKSSFANAFEFLIEGRITSLEGAKSTSTKKHAPHIDFDATDTSVSLITQNPDDTITRTFGNIVGDESSFWQTAQNSNFILRRQQLLDFIIANPSGRYEQIAQIIGVSELDTTERNLKRKYESLKEEYRTLKKKKENVEQKILQQLEIDELDESLMLSSINRKLSSYHIELSTLDGLDEAKVSIIGEASSADKVQNAYELQKTIELFS